MGFLDKEKALNKYVIASLFKNREDFSINNKD